MTNATRAVAILIHENRPGLVENADGIAAFQRYCPEFLKKDESRGFKRRANQSPQSSPGNSKFEALVKEALTMRIQFEVQRFALKLFDLGDSPDATDEFSIGSEVVPVEI